MSIFTDFASILSVCVNLFSFFLKGYLQISAERMIKAISELRHKICQARQNLEHETEVNTNSSLSNKTKQNNWNAFQFNIEF